MPDENPSIVRTPLVIAMWEPMAKALGYPDKPIGFEDILRLARSKQVGRTSGCPEYGAFKLVHTNPDSRRPACRRSSPSTTRRRGKKEGLRPED